MSTAASAVTTVESATTTVETPQLPEFNAGDQKTWSAGQKEHWNKTGEQPTTPDSATEKDHKDEKEAKDSAVADSAPQKDKPADTASDSATGKDQKPHLKTKEDTEKRFKEVLDEIKVLKQQNEDLRRSSSTRDTKPDPQPPREEYRPLDDKDYFKANPKATYEDFVRAAAKHEGKWEAAREIQAEFSRRELVVAQQKLAAEVEEAKTRYPDYEQRVKPAAESLMNDRGIPDQIKALIGSSKVFTDVMYVLSEPSALADFMQTARVNPAEALRKFVLTEQLVSAELAKAKTSTPAEEKSRDAKGQFVSSDKSAEVPETKPRAPKPVAPIGGRGTAPGDPGKEGAAAGNFRVFEAAENARHFRP